MYEINTIRLLERVYGLASAQIYRPYGNVPQQPNGDAQDVQPYGVDMPDRFESDVVSGLGVPVMMPVKVIAGRYQQRLSDGTLNVVEYPEYIFPFASIFTIDQPKVIRETFTVGASSRLEYIAPGKAQIQFQGLIINQENDLPPEQGIRDFYRITDVPQPLEVECEFFDWMKIDSIVIERRRVFQIEGFSHVVGFNITAKSDSVTEARLRNDL